LRPATHKTTGLEGSNPPRLNCSRNGLEDIRVSRVTSKTVLNVVATGSADLEEPLDLVAAQESSAGHE
jgi:hypothetical protein